MHHNIKGQGFLWICFTPEEYLSSSTHVIRKERLEEQHKRVRGWEYIGYKQTKLERFSGCVKKSHRTVTETSVLSNNCCLSSCNFQTWIGNIRLCFCVALGSWCTA